MNGMDTVLLILYVMNIAKLTYFEASKLNESLGWLCAILMLLRGIN